MPRFGKPRPPHSISPRAPRSSFTPRIPSPLKNKGSRTMPMLPGRAAANSLSDPTQQTMGNYAKLTPSGAAGMNQPYSDIMNIGTQPAIQDDEG